MKFQKIAIPFFLLAFGLAYLLHSKGILFDSKTTSSAELSHTIDAELGSISSQPTPSPTASASTLEEAEKFPRFKTLVEAILSEPDSEKIPDILAQADLSPAMKQALINRQHALFRKALADNNPEALQESIYVMNAIDPETASIFAQEFFEDFLKYERRSDASRVARAFIVGILVENKSKTNIRRALEIFQSTCKSPTECVYEQGLILASE